MRYVLTILMILALPAGLSAQRGRGGVGAGQQGARMNRMALERQIMQRFMEQSSREMGLGAAERGRFERILRDGTSQRREFAERGVLLRQRLTAAIKDPETPDATFGEILEQINQLREEEHALWRADQNAMGDMFTPRQRALYTARWLRLQEVIRDVIGQRQGGQQLRQGAPLDTFPLLDAFTRPAARLLPPLPGAPAPDTYGFRLRGSGATFLADPVGG